MVTDGVVPPAGEGGLLAVHAHPDDETLSTGALLATWAAAGRPVTVVTCTRGEQGEVIGSRLAHLEGDGPALAAHREGELADALEALGVGEHAFLDALRAPAAAGGRARYVDSGMAWAGVARAAAAEHLPDGAFVGVDVDAAADDLARLIRRRRPDVVVGYEPGGGYGHPDHVQAHRVMQRALDLAQRDATGTALIGDEPWRVPVVLWSVLPVEELRVGLAAMSSFAAPGLRLPDPAGPVPACAVPGAEVDVRVDVRPVASAVVGAMRAHATQIQAVRVVDEVARTPGAGTAAIDPAGLVLGSRALSDGVLQPVLAAEAYRYAHGWQPRPVAWPAGVTAVRWPA